MSAIAAFNQFPGRHRYLRFANCFAPNFTLRCSAHTFGEYLLCLQHNYSRSHDLHFLNGIAVKRANANRVRYVSQYQTKKNPTSMVTCRALKEEIYGSQPLLVEYFRHRRQPESAEQSLSLRAGGTNDRMAIR